MNLQERRGALYGAGAYLLWGIFPLYFRLLEASGAVEVVLHRILWSLLVCAVAVAVARQWLQVRATLGSPRQVGLLAAAAAFLAVNWGVYIYAVNSGHVVEASLGYFINPLVTVLLGVVVLRERLRPAQWSAVGLGAVAVTVLTVDYGRPPVIALTLAATFGVYGLIKNRVGASVGALASLTTETRCLLRWPRSGWRSWSCAATVTSRTTHRGRACCWPAPGSRPSSRCCSSRPRPAGSRCPRWGCCSTSLPCCS
jgi:chloramphenicol-sensitive protein RarD